MSEIIKIDTAQNIVKQVYIGELQVYNDNHPSLKVIVPEYTDPLPNPKMTQLIESLKATMRKYAGIGLAANQCGVNARVFVLGSENFQFACINPEILETFGEKIKHREGCLSFPGLFLNKERYDHIKVRFISETGETKEVEFSGMTARAFQHELDHLNGIVYTDDYSELGLKLAKERQMKMINKMKRVVKNHGRN